MSVDGLAQSVMESLAVDGIEATKLGYSHLADAPHYQVRIKANGHQYHLGYISFFECHAEFRYKGEPRGDGVLYRYEDPAFTDNVEAGIKDAIRQFHNLYRTIP